MTTDRFCEVLGPIGATLHGGVVKAVRDIIGLLTWIGLSIIGVPLAQTRVIAGCCLILILAQYFLRFPLCCLDSSRADYGV